LQTQTFFGWLCTLHSLFRMFVMQNNTSGTDATLKLSEFLGWQLFFIEK